MSARITLDDYRALAEFRYQIRRFLGFSERFARHFGLEPRQHQLLLALKGLPENVAPTIGDLAERLQVEHHSAVEMIDRLQRRRLVARLRDRTDKRRVLVELTPRGDGLLRELSLSHRDELRSAAPALVQALNALMAGHHRPRRRANGRTAP